MKYDKVMMKTAELWSKESKCRKRQVGAVIAKDDRIISIGYNGTVKGSNNDCEEDVVTLACCSINVPTSSFVERYPEDDNDNSEVTVCPKCSAIHFYSRKLLEEETKSVTKNGVLHAEENALIFAAKHGLSTKDCTLYVTTAPCIKCSSLILQAGIKRVVYLNYYKDTLGLEALIDSGVRVDRLYA